jgi:ferrochelatase
MGGPSREDDIEPFLANLFADKELINFHIGAFLQKKLAPLIAKRRLKRVKPRYRLMGGGSPQFKLTQELLIKLKEIYESNVGRTVDCFIGMCYSPPYITDAVKEIALSKGQYRRIYLLPLYPHYCAATTGVAFNRFYKAAEALPTEYSDKIVKIDHYYSHPAFIEAAAKRIEAAAAVLGKQMKDIHLLFSAHSIPMSLAESGDPYLEQVVQSVQFICDRLKPCGAATAFQSRTGFAKWLKPTSHEAVAQLAAEGVKDVVVYPISFINDHIETLYDIDVDLNQYAKKAGLNMARAEVFNASEDFAEVLADVLQRTQ